MTESQALRISERYTPDQLLERTRRAFEAAIEVYTSVMSHFFAPMSKRLRKAVVFPANLVGVLYYPENYPEAILYWYLDPLPKDSKTTVSIELSESEPDHSRLGNLDALYQNLVGLRPEAAAWISARSQEEVLRLHLFASCPATTIAYKWLREDLEEGCWLGH